MYQHVSRKSISSQSLQILTYAVFFWNYDACNVLLPRYPMKIIYLQHHMRTIYSPEDAQCCILLIGGTSDEYLLRGEGGHWLVKFGPLKKVNGWSKKGPIFKISKLTASFEALCHLRAIKTGNSWAWCTIFPCISMKNQVFALNLVHEAHESPVLMALRWHNASKEAASFEILKSGPIFDQPLPFFIDWKLTPEKR